MTEEAVTITKSQFQQVAAEAFKAAGATTIERMVEIARDRYGEDTSLRVQHIGAECLAELDQA